MEEITVTLKAELLDLSQGTVGFYRDGSSDFVTSVPGPPRRMDGLLGAARR